jgi:hypothetical protein
MALAYVADQKSSLAKIATALYEGSSLMQSDALTAAQRITSSAQAIQTSNQIKSEIQSGSSLPLNSMSMTSQQEVSFLLK